MTAIDFADTVGARIEDNAATLATARADALAALDGQGRLVAHDPAAQAVAVVQQLADDAGVELVIPPSLRTTGDPLAAVLRATGLRTRPVTLGNDWQRDTTGPMVGFTVTGSPVALLPRRGGYRVVDPATGASHRVGSSSAPAMAPRALAVYRPLHQGALTLRSLLRWAVRGTRSELGTLFAAGLAAGLLGLVVPVSAGLVVPRLVATGGPSQLWWLGALLAAVAVTMFLLLLVRNAAAVRIQGRLQQVLEPAVWDRLLSHDAHFFQRFSNGDLVQRANSIAEARRALSDVVVSALLGAVFSLASLLAVVVIDPRLGGLVAGGTVALVVALIALAARQQEHERTVFELYGEVYGLLYALLLGIDKLQTAGREVQAFARWARIFGRQKQADAATLRQQALSTALVTGAQPLLLAVLIGGITVLGITVDVAHTLVAAIAVAQVALALGQVGQLAATAYGVVPVLDRLRPVLEPTREVSERAVDPGRLRGAVEIAGLSHRYAGATRPTLDDVTLHAEPGEFVAVVGPSGAGKSTIVRLLLGFEQPLAGTVRYDGRDLGALDVRLVRRQLGVVLQNSRLLRGTLLENLIGAAPELSEDDAWRAAELAGIADDLRALPLGLATRVGEDGAGFSGGQVQRLLLARALARRPSILVLDEATSALDNATQYAVSEHIAALSCTRIVIAHRLSTIRRADRIYVLADGRVTAHGTYAELLETSPMFTRLVRRQELS